MQHRNRLKASNQWLLPVLMAWPRFTAENARKLPRAGARAHVMREAA